MHSNFFRLDRQVSIVTGASRGIGKAIALAHAQYGAHVVVSSRNLDVCKKVVDEISSQGGVAAATEANISKKDSLQCLIDFTLDRFGQIDHLVCNAASNPFYGPLSEIPDDAFEKILKNNILSNHWLASLSSRHISKSPSGSIVIVSSIAGLKGTPGLGAYAVSKAADMQLVRNLSLELGSQNIRVNGIAPGLIKTDFAKALWDNEEIRQHYESKTPLKRIGSPEDIAGISVFLASKASAYITGQTLVADGGITITG